VRLLRVLPPPVFIFSPTGFLSFSFLDFSFSGPRLPPVQPENLDPPTPLKRHFFPTSPFFCPPQTPMSDFHAFVFPDSSPLLSPPSSAFFNPSFSFLLLSPLLSVARLPCFSPPACSFSVRFSFPRGPRDLVSEENYVPPLFLVFFFPPPVRPFLITFFIVAPSGPLPRFSFLFLLTLT